jgi:hypothetical protein
VQGIDATGRVVGTGIANGVAKLYFRNANGTFMNAGVPQFGTTSAAGMNDSGTFVGYFKDKAGVYHAVLKDIGKKFVQLDPPGSDLTLAAAVSANRKVVGTYKDAAGLTHGYLATGIK